MEKTIKNCIWELFTIKSGIKNELQQADGDKKETDEEQIEFLNYAIDIIKKYQKIEDIYYHQMGQALENSLRAVIEE